MDIERAIKIKEDQLAKTPLCFREKSIQLMFDIADLQAKQRKVTERIEQIPEARNVP